METEDSEFVQLVKVLIEATPEQNEVLSKAKWNVDVPVLGMVLLRHVLLAAKSTEFHSNLVPSQVYQAWEGILDQMGNTETFLRRFLSPSSLNRDEALDQMSFGFDTSVRGEE